MVVLNLIAKISLALNTRQLTDLAGMSDDEFMSRIGELKSEKSLHFRAVCARRWVRIMFPNELYESREEDAWRVWGDVELGGDVNGIWTAKNGIWVMSDGSASKTRSRSSSGSAGR